MIVYKNLLPPAAQTIAENNHGPAGAAAIYIYLSPGSKVVGDHSGKSFITRALLAFRNPSGLSNSSKIRINDEKPQPATTFEAASVDFRKLQVKLGLKDSEHPIRQYVLSKDSESIRENEINASEITLRSYSLPSMQV